MKIDLSPILSGETDKISLNYPLTVSVDFNGITFPNPARVLGTIKNSAGYISLSVEVTLQYEAECDRCLKPIHPSFTLQFQRTIVSEGSLQHEEDADEYLFIKDKSVDPDESIIEMLILEFPTKHLCKEDCKGLCPRCGKDLNEGPCSCNKKEIDPRLAGLAKFLKK